MITQIPTTQIKQHIITSIILATEYSFDSFNTNNPENRVLIITEL